MSAMFIPLARLALLAALALLSISASLSAGQAPLGQALMRAAAETNVNQRYVIESVSVAGVQVDEWEGGKLPPDLRAQIKSLIGSQCDMKLIGTLGDQLRKELHLQAVREHLSKGSSPDHIRVNFEVVKKEIAFDLSVPKFLYHSKQGWSGEVDASTRLKHNVFAVGVLSNGDDLTERFAGITAHYENTQVGTSRVRFGFGFEDYHEQWNLATREAVTAAGMDLYRARRNVAPELTFVVAKPLTVSFGASFERLEVDTPAAAFKQANAITGEVHYGRKFEDAGDSEQEIDARYNFRAGSRALGSDYGYTRHKIVVRYSMKSGKQSASSEFTGGCIDGAAPEFERFVLGTSSTLRGWNRYEIDALGGNRVVHNSLTYGYRFGEGTGEVFYDAGALWQPGDSAKVRHSLGMSYRQGIFVLTMAFPVRDGRTLPVLMVGMNY